jgi:hypothetical protein
MRLFAIAPLLLLAGCDMARPPISPLIEAARAGDTAGIARLAGAGSDLNAPGGVNNWTPLMHAIHKHQANSVKALLEAGADVNRISGRTTALILAAGYGDAEIVGILLEHGADARLALPDGRTALSAAVEGSNDMDQYTAGSCQTETVQALLRHDPRLRVPAESAAARTASKAGCKEILALAVR